MCVEAIYEMKIAKRIEVRQFQMWVTNCAICYR